MFPIVPLRPFLAAQLAIKSATEPWEQAGSFRLRREVFCDEQRLFRNDDRDAVDVSSETIVAVAYVMGAGDRVVGTVRIHEPEPGIWIGSRLALAREYRGVSGLGSALVRRAVGTARTRGCLRFYAAVQASNVPFFLSLRWETLAEAILHGRPHVWMRADLDAYPPCEDVVLPLPSRRAS